MFPEYSSEESLNRKEFVYFNATNDAGLNELFIKYHLSSYVGEQTFEKALFFMEWVCNRLFYKEMAQYDGRQNAIQILNFCKSNRVTVNCLCHATVVSEILLALNYKVKKIYALSFDLLPNENHVILDVFMADLNKWVMLDPSICSYLTDFNDVPLSVREIRENLIQEKKMYISNYNKLYKYFNPTKESMISSDDMDCYMAYLYKDFFRFVVSLSQHSDSIVTTDDIMLLPTGYLRSNMIIENYAGKKGKVHTTFDANYFWK